ncbi:amidase [Pontibacillus litoralis]|uniref:Amidase domain-containing protein n=1 Tax=Pontibacillus litoralis JSM 072002 TaxID=1385512 RepID=A0A0A5G1M2_9BACI|nr:amidase [Pontibacillus litoralis]KGX84993.1 hypothetical protein N784_11500 [Pontibacillus litoralis JSM 072002]
MNMEERIQQVDGLGLKALLNEGELTTLDVTNFYIKQIKAKNPALNAVVHTMFDEALANAETILPTQGTLAGLPFLIKDLNDVQGQPTTHGSNLLEGYVAKDDEMLTKRYRNAGLVFLGKTNTPEFGFLATTEPTYIGPARNPWDLTRSAGGSSGGAAAAVAAGMVPFAHGSDGGGSIRIPASCCGLFGLKPSRGRGPYGMYMNDIAVNHSLTRSVRDSAALLDAMKGKGNYESYPPLAQDVLYLNEVHREPRSLKVAVAPNWNNQVSISPENEQAIEETVTLLQELGHQVTYDTPVFDFQQFAEDFITIWIASGSVIMKHLGQLTGNEPNANNVEPLSYDVWKQGEQYSALEYEEARIRMQMVAKKVLAFYDQYDIMVTPVLNGLPAKVGAFSNQQHAREDMLDTMTNYVSFTQIANATGQPAMSVPLHWTKEGLPVGVHFMGRLSDEQTLFQLAGQLERKRPWFHRYNAISL